MLRVAQNPIMLSGIKLSVVAPFFLPHPYFLLEYYEAIYLHNLLMFCNKLECLSLGGLSSLV
jgi:hypothetical protein